MTERRDKSVIVSLALECCVSVWERMKQPNPLILRMRKMRLKEEMTRSETLDLLVTHLGLRSRPLLTVCFPQGVSPHGLLHPGNRERTKWMSLWHESDVRCLFSAWHLKHQCPMTVKNYPKPPQALRGGMHFPSRTMQTSNFWSLWRDVMPCFIFYSC